MNQSFEAFMQRTYFYVGGQYIDDGSGKGTEIMTDQMYVERLLPGGGSKHRNPLVFVHGGAQTGTNWLNTPDGRQGWASWFVERGYEVYIVDLPARGRSAAQPSDTIISLPAEYIERYFTATAHFKLWPQAELHSQWPGNGQKGDPTFDAFYASQVQFQKDPTISESAARSASVSLLTLTGRAILICHSQSGPYCWAAADSTPTQVAGIVAIEPAGPPFMEAITRPGGARPWGISSTPLTYSPPVANPATDLPTVTLAAPATRFDSSQFKSFKQQASPPKRLVNLASIPILVVSSESGYHTVYDFATVSYLRQAGCLDVRHMELSKEGVHGNGHFMFLEMNNLEIAALIETWIAERGRKLI